MTINKLGLTAYIVKYEVETHNIRDGTAMQTIMVFRGCTRIIPSPVRSGPHEVSKSRSPAMTQRTGDGGCRNKAETETLHA